MFSVDEMKLWLRLVIKTMALTCLLGQPCWNMQSSILYSAHWRYVLSLHPVIRWWWLRTHWLRWKRLFITIYLTIMFDGVIPSKIAIKCSHQFVFGNSECFCYLISAGFYLLNDLTYEIGLNWSQSSVVTVTISKVWHAGTESGNRNN